MKKSCVLPSKPCRAAAYRYIVITLIVLAITAMTGKSALAQPKLRIPFPFKRVEADPGKSYVLREEHGPWLILAASFLGERGELQARDLVLELRKKHKMKAYVFKRDFNFGETVRGLGVDKFGNPKRMKHVHSSHFEETAVLVGDFPSHDDAKAQKILEKLKYAMPESLLGRSTQRMGVWRYEIQRRMSANKSARKKGPMRGAFITRNPILPEAYFADQGPDRLILSLNRGLEYSLLDCDKKFTVRVATFRGKSTWNVDEIQGATQGPKSAISAQESQLAQGAAQARKLVSALRRRGIEAYQFHDRHESIVTVGSFDSVGEKRSDGKIEINPQIHSIINGYRAQQENHPGLPGALSPRLLEGIPFDAQPIPVEVPHR